MAVERRPMPGADREPSRERALLPARRQDDDARALPEHANRRIIIEHVRPAIDGGRFPVKRTVGESVAVSADIFADGHDVISAVLKYRRVPGATPDETSAETAIDALPEPWREIPMASPPPGSDEWTAHFDVSDIGPHEYAVVGWIDHFRTWRRDLQIKAAAGQDVVTELIEGSLMIRDAAARAEQQVSEQARADADCLLVRADALSHGTALAQQVAAALSDGLAAMMDRYPDRSRVSTSLPMPVWVDRERARFGAWYEMFPRSSGPDPRNPTEPKRSGTFREAAAMLPRLADLGFDVVYLPPIHPIGRQFRKGANNRLTAQPGDPGSPWAIGSADGGHTAVEPGLGTVDDFMAFRTAAERLGLEIALDLAWQCSPDHPWVREHPEWFRHRPDGTIKYAENPPKKYQDIYPLDFECDDWRGLWGALLDVTLAWVDRGVRIFRVDNPHTKAFPFWEWTIANVQRRHPDVIFLAEAFTRPPVMRYLAKAGFTQSYTYFTWRNSKPEITEYLTELTSSDVREYLRPNLFANTPDILHAYLQQGGKPAFEARLLLAATLGASYGIYSGFELCENQAVPGTEEYLDSEKYQYRHRDWTRPGHIQELIARVNLIRHRYRALQSDWTLRFHDTDNPFLIAYSKTSAGRPGRASDSLEPLRSAEALSNSAGGGVPSANRESRVPASSDNDVLLMVVNLDPHHMQHGFVQVPREFAAGNLYTVCDLLDDAEYEWHGEWNYVRLEPGIRQGHILRLTHA